MVIFQQQYVNNVTNNIVESEISSSPVEKDLPSL